ncbi:type II toxin-antitoxin system HicB family antitoxin [Spongisporangium articulatum]|uniref:Type II toxin-antitoxin system HicB family antitoxin n=1 Tax=Spongisporangium articulatum TaxID=3362603 RepID=A0ABW8AJU9_9ACTN
MSVITMQYHHEGGSWWAESDDVPGFSALADSLAALRAEVREGLAFHFEDGDVADLDVRELIVDQAASVVSARLSVWESAQVYGTSSGSAAVVDAITSSVGAALAVVYPAGVRGSSSVGCLA